MSPAISSPDEPQRPWAAFWRLVLRFDQTKISIWVGLRNALGVLIPLLAGVLTGHTGAGLILATGALNVSFSDGQDAYHFRAQRMLIASTLVAIAVLCGVLAGHYAVSAVLVAGGCAFAAGMMVALGQTAADFGVISLVTLVVYSAQPMDLRNAFAAGALALAGGLLQTGLPLGSWTTHPYKPLQRSIAELFANLANFALLPANVYAAPPASAASNAAQEAMTRYAWDQSWEAEKYRALLSQAERIRLSLLTLGRLRRRLERESEAGKHEASMCLAAVEKVLAGAAHTLSAIGTVLLVNNATATEAKTEADGTSVSDFPARAAAGGTNAFLSALMEDARFQTEALTGQLRAASDLAAVTTPEGIRKLASLEAQQPRETRDRSRWSILRANLALQSAVFRHALRLAVCVAAAEAVGRGVGLHRFYWLPMTVAILLRPDFSSTFSRGILRMAGTLIGLVVATAVYHVWPLSPIHDAVLAAVFVFLLRSVGPANYGVFTIMISAVVVYLFALLGVRPQEVVHARFVNTLLGGAVALLAYWVWPTWEHSQFPDILARLLESYRDYWKAIADSYRSGDAPSEELGQRRLAARLARSNAEASVGRLGSEPGFPAQWLRLAGGILASSHRLIHAFMALEAGLSGTPAVAARKEFVDFSDQVRRMLTLLASELRGGRTARRDFPELRGFQRKLVAAGGPGAARYTLVNVETDRITNSLNTLRMQVHAWINRGKQQPAPADGAS
jgi:uncharacterized membrane protein YccC